MLGTVMNSNSYTNMDIKSSSIINLIIEYGYLFLSYRILKPSQHDNLYLIYLYQVERKLININ